MLLAHEGASSRAQCTGKTMREVKIGSVEGPGFPLRASHCPPRPALGLSCGQYSVTIMLACSWANQGPDPLWKISAICCHSCGALHMVVQRAPSLLVPPPGSSCKCAGSNQIALPPSHLSHCVVVSADKGMVPRTSSGPLCGL